MPVDQELCSWKQVASYLGVSIRTAQILERDRGLPIRRLAGPRGRITASIAEIDQWKDGHTSASTIPAPATRRGVAARWAVVMVLPIIWAAATAVRSALPGRPASFRIERNVLVVLDASGRETWRQHFPKELEIPSRLVWFGDLDSDGKTEVLVAPAQKENRGGTTPLICFSERGVERWRFTPGGRVHTATEEFAPAYNPYRFQVGRTRKDSPAWIVVASEHDPYYPGQIALLDIHGELIREYWHPGHLFHLQVADLDGDGNNELYFAGINNARKAATLVVLDPERFTGAAIEAPPYYFQDFPAPVERARVILPRTCLSQAFDPYNTVNQLVVAGDGVTVETREIIEEGRGVIHHFSTDLHDYRSTLTDSYLVRLSQALANHQIPPSCTIAQKLTPTIVAASTNLARRAVQNARSSGARH